MNNSLKQRTGFAIFWNFIDKGGQQFLQLIFGVVLARILLPSDLGTFALLAIFIAVANILQESGFSSALIRKKEPTEKDFSSVFFFNITVSVLVYAIFFFTTPFISQFYDNPILTNLARLVFLSFVFNAFGLIQNIILVRNMDFKTNTKITLISSSLSGVIAISLAVNGYGVWSLAAQLVLQTLLRSILLWLFVKWVPKNGFYKANIKLIMPYSMRLLATSLMNQICANIYANIIGKYFSTYQAGIYSQANKFAIIPQSVISDGIKGAAFPALTKIENDIDYTKKAFRKIVRITAFISFPIALLVMATAKPVVLLLITEKWAEAIPVLQILTIGAAFYPLYGLISTLLQTIGKTGLIFKIETVRNAFSLALIFFTIHYGVLGLVAGFSAVGIIFFFIGMAVAGREIKYTIWEILKDTLSYVTVAIVAILPFFFLENIGVANLFILLITPALGLLIYLTILKITGSVMLDESIAFFRQMIKKLGTK